MIGGIFPLSIVGGRVYLKDRQTEVQIATASAIDAWIPV